MRKNGENLFNQKGIFSEDDAKQLSSIALAFVGDAVYSLYVRQKLVESNDSKTGELNKISSEIVCAKAQSKRIIELMSILTEEEIAIFKRARNAKKGAKAKNASVVEYNNSTGFEAVLGYLYLTGNSQRLEYILEYENNED